MSLIFLMHNCKKSDGPQSHLLNYWQQWISFKSIWSLVGYNQVSSWTISKTQMGFGIGRDKFHFYIKCLVEATQVTFYTIPKGEKQKSYWAL